MKLRQEVWVLLGVSVLLTWLVATRLGAPTAARRGAPRAAGLELVPLAPLDPSVARAGAGAQRRLERSLFDPPSDTRPLPPLGFAEPPRGPMGRLSPPPVPGPRARHFAPHLEDWSAIRPVAGLFDGGVGADVAAAPPLDATTEGTPAASGPLGPAERAALEEGYRRLFDWVELTPGRPLFGRISNADRFALPLPERAGEALRFEELDPAKAAPRYPGQGPIALERARVAAFGFADTLGNRLELEARALAGRISASNYAAALELAERCLEVPFEVPRALELARGLLLECAALEPGEPEPKFLLARALELDFKLDEAYAVHRQLAEEFPHRGAVHLARAEFEGRLWLDEEAERSFREALAKDSGFGPKLGFARFLLQRGRSDEALAVLEGPMRSPPQGADQRELRLELRLAFAEALAAEGRLEEAMEQHVLAWRGAPESQAALAGCVALLPHGGARASDFELPNWLLSEVGGEVAPFEVLEPQLLLAKGDRLRDLGEFARARDAYFLALAADPLGTARALLRLSHLAERAGYPDEALGFVESALGAAPSDPYGLYQRARLLAERGDWDSAEADLFRALEFEADFAAALARLGELAWRRGKFADSELFLERALELSPNRADWWELRALALVAVDAFLDAREAAQRVVELDGTRFAARAVLAFCAYRLESPEEALVRFSELDDSLRGLPADGPERAYIQAQKARLEEHRLRVVWSDGFERSNLANQWTQEDTVGPLLRLEDGRVVIEGTFTRAGETRLWREYPAEEFVSLELDLEISSSGAARIGVFVGRESGRAGPRQLQAQVAIAQNRDGSTQFRIVRGSTGEELWTDLPAAEFGTDRPVRVRIERSGEGSDAVVGVALDGIPVLENVRVPGLGRAATPLRVGVFAEGETGRQVRLAVDNVDVVRRQGR